MMAGNLGAWAADRFGVAVLTGGGGGLGLPLDQLGRSGAVAGRVCGLAHRLADRARQNIVIITAPQALP
ncbi:hypothetical protein V8F63_01245 [Brevundimonas sp. LF-1]|uniref:hypothetical protein n=1 Tax=Brevundimonas sp. LF-1 TaxID=3126100 RepID=UPI0030E53CAF